MPPQKNPKTKTYQKTKHKKHSKTNNPSQKKDNQKTKQKNPERARCVILEFSILYSENSI